MIEIGHILFAYFLLFHEKLDNLKLNIKRSFSMQFEQDFSFTI